MQFWPASGSEQNVLDDTQAARASTVMSLKILYVERQPDAGRHPPSPLWFSTAVQKSTTFGSGLSELSAVGKHIDVAFDVEEVDRTAAQSAVMTHAVSASQNALLKRSSSPPCAVSLALAQLVVHEATSTAAASAVVAAHAFARVQATMQNAEMAAAPPAALASAPPSSLPELEPDPLDEPLPPELEPPSVREAPPLEEAPLPLDDPPPLDPKVPSPELLASSDPAPELLDEPGLLPLLELEQPAARAQTKQAARERAREDMDRPRALHVPRRFVSSSAFKDAFLAAGTSSRLFASCSLAHFG
jgi:hypothetical protein